jgi:hypothetical protein
MLLDMHIPDWDPSFLSRYDPAHVASLYERADVSSVMLYCNSHAGLTYWPTAEMHPGVRGRDVVGDLLHHVHEKGIAACAYYSVVFDNRAVLDHPDWWVRPVVAGDGLGASPLLRYGVCCPNNPDYVEFTRGRIEDLLKRYAFDCLFYDMTFWPAVCGCGHCRARFGGSFPDVVDWTSPAWCAFQSFRERSIAQFVRTIVGYAKAVRPDMPVYNNFALAVADWWPGFPFEIADEIDFTGGDMYGDHVEQLVVSKLMGNLSPRTPPEFMTSTCVNLRDHARLKDREQLRMQAFAATAVGSAMLFIDAIDPDGRTNDALYDVIGGIFAETRVYEPFLGGRPVEDVAVYHSSESRMRFAEHGAPVGRRRTGPTPHQSAVRSACRALQRAHVPFGVITRRQLSSLSEFRVVVLPDVSRMDADEVDALREYVRSGGHVYATGMTSLTETSASVTTISCSQTCSAVTGTARSADTPSTRGPRTTRCAPCWRRDARSATWVPWKEWRPCRRRSPCRRCEPETGARWRRWSSPTVIRSREACSTRAGRRSIRSRPTRTPVVRPSSSSTAACMRASIRASACSYGWSAGCCTASRLSSPTRIRLCG